MEISLVTTQLESTIIKMASDGLMLLQSYANDPATPENQSAFSGQWQRILSLVELGHISGSGLSEVAVAELLRIEQVATGVWSQYVEKYGIGQAKH